MGTPPQDHPCGPARRILGRDSAGNPDQNPIGTRLSDRQHAAARDARDDFLGATASAPANDGRLPDDDAEIDAQAQSRMPWAAGAANHVTQSQLSSGSRHAEGSDPDASSRAISRRATGACRRTGTLVSPGLKRRQV